MSDSAESDVFISGASTDRAAAVRLADKLRENGLSVFRDDEQLIAGQDWLRTVDDAMRRSKAVAVLVSSSTDPTGVWLNEIELAIGKARDGTLLIPVFLENVDPLTLPLGLRRFNGVYARTEDELAVGAAAIARAVHAQRDDRSITRVYGAVPPRPQCYIESSDVNRTLFTVRGALAERDGPVWLTGIAGSGKSVVASEVCRHLSSEVDIIWWITATSEESVVGGLASLSQALGIGPPSPGTLRDYAHKARDFLARESVSWLLVLDDVNDETNIREWLPKTYNAGTCLVTSRIQPSIRYKKRTIVIDPLSAEEAVQLLRRLLRDSVPEGAFEHEIRALADTLGGHPLALQLAASSIRVRGDADPNRLTALLDELTSRKPIDASQSVRNTFEAALARASVRHPVASNLFNAMGWLSNEPFPLEMFRDASDDPFLSSTPSEITEAIDALNSHALVSVDNDLVSISHDLIRAFARSISTDAADFLLHLMTPAFSNPEAPHNWSLCTRLYPHVLELGRLIAQVEELQVDTQRESLELRVGTARYLMTAGFSDEALTLLVQTLADSERILGSDHPSTLSVRANLAGIYQTLGRYAEAEALLQQTLADRERVLGSDHPSTLSVRANLAGIYQSLGQHPEAEALLQRTLADSERVLGRDHPSTLSVRADLAGTYQTLGRYAEAETLMRQTLADSERVLGSDHPSRLTIRANLAGVYFSLGRYTEAEALLQQTLADSERILGGDHPSTLAIQANLDFVVSHGRYD